MANSLVYSESWVVSQTIIPDELEGGTYVSTTPDTNRLLFFRFKVPFPNASPTPPHTDVHRHLSCNLSSGKLILITPIL